MYICVCMYIHTRMYVYVYINMYVYIYKYICTHKYSLRFSEESVFVYTYVQLCICVCVLAWSRAKMAVISTCIYIYTQNYWDSRGGCVWILENVQVCVCVCLCVFCVCTASITRTHILNCHSQSANNLIFNFCAYTCMWHVTCSEQWSNSTMRSMTLPPVSNSITMYVFSGSSNTCVCMCVHVRARVHVSKHQFVNIYTYICMYIYI